MRTYYRFGGKSFGKFIEFNFDFTRWLIGFGWYTRVFHINIGPFAIIIGI